MKTPAGRAKKIAALVEMLARGETISPTKPPKAAKTTGAGPQPKGASATRRSRIRDSRTEGRGKRPP